MIKLTIVTIGKGNYAEVMKTYDSYSNFRGRLATIFVGCNFTEDQQLNLKNIYNETYFDIDKSLYNAMNIAILNCQTDYIFFVNSGDQIYSENHLNDILLRLDLSKDLKCYVAPTILNCNGRIALIPKTKFIHKLLISSGHSGFIAPIALKKFYFNEKLTITADGVWMDQYRNIASTEIFPFPLVVFDYSGISSAPLNLNFLKISGEYFFKIKNLIKYVIVKIIGINNFFRLVVIKNSGSFVK